MIEVKPSTGCNINCVFCSVDEGLDAKKAIDYLVEDDYIVQELKRLMDYKGTNDLEIYINPHGEPLLYPKLTELVAKMAELSPKMITIITNGLLLSKKLADELVQAGLTQINISVNSMSPEKAKEIAGTCSYNIDHIKDVLVYLKGKVRVVLTPVWLKGVNDSEMQGIILFAKEHGFEVGMQNFIRHKQGRKAAKEARFEDFYSSLRNLEKEHDIRLVMDYKQARTKEYPAPFKRGDVVEAEVILEGRHKCEKIGIAQGRTISIAECRKEGMVKVRILRSLHNIFAGKAV